MVGVWIPVSTLGSSQLSLPPAPRGQIYLSGLHGHTHACAHTHTFLKNDERDIWENHSIRLKGDPLNWRIPTSHWGLETLLPGNHQKPWERKQQFLGMVLVAENRNRVSQGCTVDQVRDKACWGWNKRREYGERRVYFLRCLPQRSWNQ